MYQCRFTDCNECTTPWQAVIVEDAVRVWWQEMYGNSVLVVQCRQEPKTTLKNKIYQEEKSYNKDLFKQIETRGLITTRPEILEILKEILQTKGMLTVTLNKEKHIPQSE